MDKATHVKKQTQFSDKTLQTYYIFHVTRREQNVTLKLKTYSTHLVTLPVEVLFSHSESDDLVLRGPMTVRLTNVRYFQLKHQSSYLLISVNMISVFNGPFPASFFFILVFSVQLIKVPMTGFELQISGIRSNFSTNCATTTAQPLFS